MGTYVTYRLWWEQLYGTSSYGLAGFWPSGKLLPTNYTCKARTEKEAMRWGEKYFLRTGAYGGIKMIIDDGAMFVGMLVDEDEKVRRKARRMLNEIQTREV